MRPFHSQCEWTILVIFIQLKIPTLIIYYKHFRLYSINLILTYITFIYLVYSNKHNHEKLLMFKQKHKLNIKNEYKLNINLFIFNKFL